MVVRVVTRAAGAPGTAGAGYRNRYAQCDDTCTVDCGACKGVGGPAVPDLMGNLQRSLGLPEGPAVPVPHAEPTDGLRDALIGAAAGLPAAEWDGHREATRLRAVHGPAVDRMLAGPLADLLAKLQAVEALAGDLARSPLERRDRAFALLIRRALAGQHTTDEEDDRG